MNNNVPRHTRLNTLLSNIDNFKFAIAIGHGTHEPSLPAVLVPKDTYVIFTSKPGYLGDTSDIYNRKFMNAFGTNNRVRQLLRGNLPREQIPKLLTNKQWDWKKHIYPPGAIIANHSLQLFDRPLPKNSPSEALGKEMYDRLSGVWKVGTVGKELHGTTQNLQDILNFVRLRISGKLIVFISGCRGDPAVSKESLRRALSLTPNGFRQYFQVPQNYDIPYTNYINKVTKLEEESSRYFSAKRIANSGEGSRKRVRVTTNNLNAELQKALNTRSKKVLYLNMINKIKNTDNVDPSRARAINRNFFGNMRDENIMKIINSIKNGTINKNNVSNLIRSGNYENYRVNSGHGKTRFIARLRNMGVI